MTEISDPFKEGFIAAAHGGKGSSDPYAGGTDESRAWCKGWRAGRASVHKPRGQNAHKAGAVDEATESIDGIVARLECSDEAEPSDIRALIASWRQLKESNRILSVQAQDDAALIVQIDGSLDQSNHADPVEVRKNDDGRIDEIIIRSGLVHIEQKSDDGWFVGIDAANGDYWQFWFGSKNRKSHVRSSRRLTASRTILSFLGRILNIC